MSVDTQISGILSRNKQIFEALNITLAEPEMYITYKADLMAEAEV